MFAALFIVSTLTAHTAPAPTQTVLAGCSTASAIRAAEIRLTAPDATNMRDLLGDILAERDGAACLLESDVLVSLYRSGANKDLVGSALAIGLASDDAAVSRRADAVAGQVRDFDPAGYDDVLRKIDGKRGSWRSFGTGPAPRVPAAFEITAR